MNSMHIVLFVYKTSGNICCTNVGIEYAFMVSTTGTLSIFNQMVLS